MPLIKNIAADLTPEQLMDQVTRHHETRKHLEEIVKMQQVFAAKVREVVQIIELSVQPAEFSVKLLKKPHHITRKNSDEAAGEVHFEWQNDENETLESNTLELEFLRILDLILVLREKFEEREQQKKVEQENSRQKALEFFACLEEKCQPFGLEMTTPDQWNFHHFSREVQEQAQRISKLGRKKWKEEVETFWKKHEKDINTHLATLAATSVDSSPEPFLSAEEMKAIQKAVISLTVEKKTEPSELQNDLEYLKGWVESRCKKMSYVPTSNNALLELSRTIQDPVTVKLSKKREKKEKNSSSGETSLPINTEPLSTPTLPKQRSVRILNIFGGIGLMALGMTGIAIGTKVIPPQNEKGSPAPVSQKTQNLAEVKERTRKYANFELDDRWNEYCQRNGIDREGLEIRFHTSMLKACLEWVNEVETLGNFPNKKWKVIPSQGQVVGASEYDLILSEGNEANWDGFFKHHIRAVLSREHLHDPIARTLLFSFEYLANTGATHTLTPVQRLFPEINTLPINTNPTNTVNDGTEDIIVLTALKSYPQISHDLLKKWLKHVLKNPPQQDFIKAHVEYVEQLSPGFKKYFESQPFYTSTFGKTMPPLLNRLVIENGVVHGISIQCSPALRNGQTIWERTNEAPVYVTVRNGIRDPETFFSGQMSIAITPDLEKVIILKNGVELTSIDIPLEVRGIRSPQVPIFNHVFRGDKEGLANLEIPTEAADLFIANVSAMVNLQHQICLLSPDERFITEEARRSFGASLRSLPLDVYEITFTDTPYLRAYEIVYQGEHYILFGFRKGSPNQMRFFLLRMKIERNLEAVKKSDPVWKEITFYDQKVLANLRMDNPSPEESMLRSRYVLDGVLSNLEALGIKKP